MRSIFFLLLIGTLSPDTLRANVLYHTEYQYNDFNLLTAVKNNASSDTTSSFTYTYNKNLQIITLTSLSTNNHNSTTYTYDSQNRLISDKENANTTTYNFDLQSNLRSESNPQGRMNRSYNLAGQLIVVTGPQQDLQINYDPLGAGDVMSDSAGENFHYNVLNELTQYTDPATQTTTYTYDSTGECLTKQNNLGTQNFYYNGIQLMNSKDPGQSQLTSYLFGNSREAFIYDNQNPQFYFYNLHADVIQLMDNAGNISQRYNYDAYGNGNNPKDMNPIRYSGYVYASESNLYYLNARYYNPDWQMFLTRDTTNQFDYKYVNGNPVMGRDPTGHTETSFIQNTNQALIYSIDDKYFFHQFKTQQSSCGPNSIAILETLKNKTIFNPNFSENIHFTAIEDIYNKKFSKPTAFDNLLATLQGLPEGRMGIIRSISSQNSFWDFLLYGKKPVEGHVFNFVVQDKQNIHFLDLTTKTKSINILPFVNIKTYQDLDLHSFL